jgi:hypothetical protein
MKNCSTKRPIQAQPHIARIHAVKNYVYKYILFTGINSKSIVLRTLEPAKYIVWK